MDTARIQKLLKIISKANGNDYIQFVYDGSHVCIQRWGKHGCDIIHSLKPLDELIPELEKMYLTKKVYVPYYTKVANKISDKPLMVCVYIQDKYEKWHCPAANPNTSEAMDRAKKYIIDCFKHGINVFNITEKPNTSLRIMELEVPCDD
jgi:hypothetical protein